MTPRNCTRCRKPHRDCECEDYQFQNGGAWLFDQDVEVPARWGDGSDVLWAQGEALLLTGSPGTGKTTIAGQLVRALLGLQDRVLGYPVAPAARVLYLAMDRPRQISRALMRSFRSDDRQVVAEKLVTWEGPPPGDLAKHPEMLRDMALSAGADVVIVDSLKDAAVGLVDDEVGAGWNRARQTAIAAGIDVLELHHLVKKGVNGSAPSTLAEVYGSIWISSGAGSVFVLIGEAGDSLIELRNLKPVIDPVGPLKVEHNHTTGTSHVLDGLDPLTLLRSSPSGMTASDLAGLLHNTKKPSENQKEASRRKLTNLCRDGYAEVLEEVAPARGGRPQKLYGATTSGTPLLGDPAGTMDQSADHALNIPPGHASTGSTTPTTRPSTSSATTPKRGGARGTGRSRRRGRPTSGAEGVRAEVPKRTSSGADHVRKRRGNG